MKDIKKEVANTIKADVFEMVMKSLQGIEKRQSSLNKGEKYD